MRKYRNQPRRIQAHSGLFETAMLACGTRDTGLKISSLSKVAINLFGLDYIIMLPQE